MMNFFQKKEKEPQNIEEILAQFKELQIKLKKLEEELALLKKDYKLSLQKIGIVRFNPFSGVGSDQSFSVALLDANNTGVVITSLYTRQESRVYGKSVNNGKSKYTLSEEEKQAIGQAIGKEYGENNQKIKNSKRGTKQDAEAASGGDLGAY